MIGNREQREQIKELLKEIAKENNKKYGHILDDTDCGETDIILGHYKHDFNENTIHTIRFDIISGYFIDTDGDCSETILWGNYFKLSDTFEQDMQEKIEELKEKERECKKDTKNTIERLQKVLKAIQ